MQVTKFEAPGMPLIETDDDNWYDLVVNDISESQVYLDEKNIIGQRNYDFYASRQWTEEELTEHADQNRIAYVFNEVQHKVDHLIGTQMQTRMDTKCIPREKGDEPAATELTAIIKYVEQLNDIDQLQTETFQEGLIRGCSPCVVRWEFDDVEYGYPKIERIPTNEVYWDQTAKMLTLEDARWMARVQYLTRLDLLEMFPDFEEEITRTAGQGYSQMFNIATYKQKIVGNYRITEDKSKEIVRLIEYYARYKQYQYVVMDGISEDEQIFDTHAEAKAYFDGLVEGYSQAGESIVDKFGDPLVAFVTHQVDRIRQTIIVGEEIIIDDLTALRDFPIVMFFAYFADGDYWSFVDSLIWPQILINRFFSQWDYIVGTSPKNAITVMDPLLKRGFTMEDLRKELSKTSPIIPVNSHNALNPIPNIPVNAEMFQAINFGIQRMTDYAGGRNVLGMQENAAESGKAVIARAEQGGVARLPMFDKLTLWRKQVTYRVIWWIKNYMSSNQILAVLGMDTDEIQYVNLDDGLMDSIRELKLNIVVEEANKAATMNESQFMQLKEMFSQAQFPPEITIPIMLEYSSLPSSKKTEIKDMLGFYKKYQEEQAQMAKEQKAQEQVKMASYKQNIRQQEEAGNANTDNLKGLAESNKALQEELAKNQDLLKQVNDTKLDSSTMEKLLAQKKAEEDINNKFRASLASQQKG